MEILEKIKESIQKKIPNSTLIFLVLRGSHAYGTNTETSDEDYFGVYVQDVNDIIGWDYKDQINLENNDISLMEISKFLELLTVANPSALEMLNTPDDCIIFKDECFDELLKNKELFITKKCAKTFSGYATEQIRKAKGTEKKQNWESDRVKRKTPIDFCYFLDNEKSYSLKNLMTDKKLDSYLFGLSKVPHSKDIYSLYYDFKYHRYSRLNKLSKFLYRKIFGNKFSGFRGISFEESNDIRLSSIPPNYKNSFLGYISFNKDGYIKHCDDYRSYVQWKMNTNKQRLVDVKNHNQKIDGKNMLHCRRLIEMAKEISEGKGINVKRKNAKYLLSIKRGEIDLQTLIDSAEKDLSEIQNNFKKSTLPDSIDKVYVNSILLKIRKKIYNI